MVRTSALSIEQPLFDTDLGSAFMTMQYSYTIPHAAV